MKTQQKELPMGAAEALEAASSRVMVNPAPAITPMDMLNTAVAKGADLEQLQKLMDLQERWEANQAKKAFVEALSAFKADPPTVTKNKHARFGQGDKKTEYSFAPLAEVTGAIAPALSKHGLSHQWEVGQAEGGLIKVTCVLTHVLGHSERVTLQASPDSSGSKNNIQAVGSTLTYLQRYTLLAITGLAAGDQDDDGGGPVKLITAEQKDEIIALMKATSADTAAFLKYMGLETLDDMPASQFPNAIQALNRKKKGA